MPVLVLSNPHNFRLILVSDHGARAWVIQSAILHLLLNWPWLPHPGFLPQLSLTQSPWDFNSHNPEIKPTMAAPNPGFSWPFPKSASTKHPLQGTWKSLGLESLTSYFSGVSLWRPLKPPVLSMSCVFAPPLIPWAMIQEENADCPLPFLR